VGGYEAAICRFNVLANFALANDTDLARTHGKTYSKTIICKMLIMAAISYVIGAWLMQKYRKYF
jgi:hypothetical protein